MKLDGMRSKCKHPSSRYIYMYTHVDFGEMRLSIHRDVGPAMEFNIPVTGPMYSMYTYYPPSQNIWKDL